MSEQEPPQRGTSRSDADSTLLGVAPPKLDSSADSPLRSPVLVRSGTSKADLDPELLSRVAVPNQPPRASSATTQVPPARPRDDGLRGKLESARRDLAAHPVIGMVLVPVALALGLIALTGHRSPYTRSAVTAPPAVTVTASSLAAPGSSAALLSADAIAELERRPPGSLQARELLILAEAHAQQKRATAAALREKLARDPALASDPATASQLLALSTDPLTAPEALAALTQLGAPGADLLYEVWTVTPSQADSSELARALLYSPDMRAKASPALGVALDLRVAESCEQYQAALPRALSDGDRRALHLLTKLNAKRGCGAKKSEDCYACLREKKHELTAAIDAVKSRRPPAVSAP